MSANHANPYSSSSPTETIANERLARLMREAKQRRMREARGYVIVMPTVAGAVPKAFAPVPTLADARRIARVRVRGRRDLKRQDVRIERTDGEHVEYAGPAR